MAATDMYVTTTGAGTKSGLTWANAFSLTEFKTDIEGAAEAGDRYFIKEGTYTFASAISTLRAGSSSILIELIGVVSATTAEPPTSSDWATGINRPLFSHNSYNFQIAAAYYLTRNMRFECSGAFHSLYFSSGSGYLINCKANNSNAAAYSAFNTGNRTIIINCEGISTNGIGITIGGSSQAIGCYAHDCGTDGIDIAGGETWLLHTIVDTCTTGLDIYSTVHINNCTIYNCTTGMSGTSYLFSSFLNNAIDNCTNGFKANAAGIIATTCCFDYNNWSNNTKDMSWDNGASEDNSAKGLNDTADTPNFTNAAGGDFSLNKSSALIDTGFAISLGVG